MTMRIEGSLHGTATPPPHGWAAAVPTGAAPSSSGTASSAVAADAAEPTLPPVKVIVSMVERLTGRPVRIIDASELNSLKLETPPPQRPTPLSSRPDWGVTLGVMDRGTADSTTGATTAAARATVTAPDGTRSDVSVSLALSTGFVTDQRTRVREGRSPLTDLLLISVDSALDALRSGVTDLGLEIDPTVGIARLTPAPDAARAVVVPSASDRPVAVTELDPAMLRNAAALSAGGAFVTRPLVSPLATAGFRVLERQRSDAVTLDISV